MNLNKIQKIITGIYLLVLLFVLFNIFVNESDVTINFWVGWMFIYVLLMLILK